MWAFEQIYTGNKYFSLSAIFFCIYFWVRGRHHCCVFDIQEIRRRQQEEAALKRQQQVRLGFGITCDGALLLFLDCLSSKN